MTDQSLPKSGNRFMRALFVACAVGIAWGIRGDFGGYIGALYPGAILGLAFAMATGRREMLMWMPLLGLAGALGIAAGGEMSYAVLHGYAKSDTFINYSYGYLLLFCQGAAWGIYGCAAIGLLLEKRPLTAAEWASAWAAVLMGGYLLYALVVDFIGFDINPPRSNLSIAHFGGALALMVWLRVLGRRTGLRGAALGFFGFGIAMFTGRLMEMASFQMPLPISGHWNVNEVTVGFLGAFIFTYGMLGFDFAPPPTEDNKPILLLNLFGILFVMLGIPLRHRLRILRLENRFEEWTNAFQGYGYEDATLQVEQIVAWLNLICWLTLPAALCWIVIHRKRIYALRGFPVVALTLLMSLYQKIHAHYFWYPRPRWELNMHEFYWGFLAVMLFTSFWLRTPFPTTDEEQVSRIPWRRWIVATVGIYLLVIAVAGLYVNRDGKTMGSANTRWPVWSWRDGPFPGREK